MVGAGPEGLGTEVTSGVQAQIPGMGFGRSSPPQAEANCEISIFPVQKLGYNEYRSKACKVLQTHN